MVRKNGQIRKTVFVKEICCQYFSTGIFWREIPRMPVQNRLCLESKGILPGLVDYQHPVDQSDSRHAAPVEESPDSVIYMSPLSGSRTSRGVASYGQYRSLPEVSQPQDGQRRNDCFLPRNGRSGTKRKRKNKGSPQNHIRSVTASDPINRMRLAFQVFMICLPGNCGIFFPECYLPYRECR